ncbi:UDP-N-acetylenolpyruvoylglucosamine reductase [Erwinia sp. OLTSP20]|uniref:UDP-N-acetylmuramate dehydrogenase n=1 Tax=unclassified Erwinia TaxID=2622719 RepID=UPI000C1853DA|nr:MULTISPECIES: UDP-N-acetylmuramate dehydrogenase [unclassified Erwinia]PIJ48081.1 UDP-N-acetylenolpyruvoylglucosamine reductase [Erwinia sp. OAMSP11]PIJ66635.1 UDP-N-acetylenolpyruvoylglucosamine reductase [Erwinia sp. OLSSP12]PIJ78185.1 UDP-N-acetylenolpyruvoylglucosamine reductase [Erwinia sp. OLCASP19]PIJ79318.1 UDP-N-acetylenolpyruvoylglucosamine reductase [Erwinia sp. OLMTSP26]PIJ80125.1 UDP-N-acetylenolpyruvoylglucosamine reductase [Erwinia sp. OLMDSP33]
MSCQQTSLTSWNTFHLNAKAAEIAVVSDVKTLCQLWQKSRKVKSPVLLLGEGSNVLFVEDFSGQVLINRIHGIDVTETGDSWHLHVGAGENWHQLVMFCLHKGIAGLENLALIPGCAGSAPIQNIGAYGVEFQQFCEYVSLVHLPTGEQTQLMAAECGFGYRESVFKHHYRDEYAIVAVGLRLSKSWQPVLTYGDLIKLNPATVTPEQVFDAVCHMRRSKLPDPDVKGNAGSFFKNPVIDSKKAETLLRLYPQIPYYPQAGDHVKLAAGWLIDRCSLKGFSVGGAMVHRQQALVLVNENHASGQDVVALARAVRQRVGQKFDIWLEPEVRFIGAQGEMDAVREIS